MPQVRQAAERALRLDLSKSEAHSSLALAAVFHERNWPDALFHSVKAVESDPNDSRARGAHAFFLAAAARHDDALAEIGRAVTLDPIAPVVLENAAFQHYWARDYELARRFCKRCFALDPEFVWGHLAAGLLEVQGGRPKAAILPFEKAAVISKGYLGFALGASGQIDRARELSAEIEHEIESGTASQHSAALVQYGLGDSDRCLECLEASIEETLAIDVLTAWMHVDPFWDSLRADPRFQDLLRRMNFPEPAASS